MVTMQATIRGKNTGFVLFALFNYLPIYLFNANLFFLSCSSLWFVQQLGGS